MAWPEVAYLSQYELPLCGESIPRVPRPGVEPALALFSDILAVLIELRGVKRGDSLLAAHPFLSDHVCDAEIEVVTLPDALQGGYRYLVLGVPAREEEDREVFVYRVPERRSEARHGLPEACRGV